jgi:hypothetical protein
MEKLLSIYKWIMSFFKKEWSVNDFPIRFENQSKENPSIPSWSAQIINWWQIAGVGDTKKEAFEDLAENFSSAKKHHDSLPRPGTGLPIEFASGDELDRYWGVASRIIDEVLGFDPEGIFVSDESSLWDFSDDDSISEYQNEIQKIFGVDVSHIQSGNLVELSKYINENS